MILILQLFYLSPVLQHSHCYWSFGIYGKPDFYDEHPILVVLCVNFTWNWFWCYLAGYSVQSNSREFLLELGLLCLQEISASSNLAWMFEGFCLISLESFFSPLKDVLLMLGLNMKLIFQNKIYCILFSFKDETQPASCNKCFKDMFCSFRWNYQKKILIFFIVFCDFKFLISLIFHSSAPLSEGLTNCGLTWAKIIGNLI